MSFCRSLKPILLGALLLTATISGAQQTRLDADKQVALDKAYQQVLFFYFQGDFFNAMTHYAMLEDQFAGELQFISNPGVNPALLKGGMSLAHGLENQATDIFAQVLQRDTKLDTQTQAWFLLGKAYYQKQQFSSAAQSFDNISYAQAQEVLDELSQDELIYLRSQLFSWLTNGQGDKIDWLSQLSGDSVYRNYVLYNQGLADLQESDYEGSVSALTELAEKDDSVFGNWLSGWWSPIQQSGENEVQALQDRANLTLGYAHLQQNKPTQAIQAFTRVRLDSLDTQAALLGYGWAASTQQDYQLALSVWERLLAMPHSSEYILEAYLASAYAYEKAFAPRQALQKLQAGLARFASELTELDQIKTQLSEEFFVSLAQAAYQPEELPPQLGGLLLSEDVRVQTTQLQESLLINRQLNQWRNRLDTFFLMLEEREQVAIKRAERLKQDKFLLRLGELQSKRDTLATALAAAQVENPMLLMSEQEQAWNSRLQKAQKRYTSINQVKAAVGQNPLSDKYQRRLARLQGALLWRVAENFPQRRWSAQKNLNALDASLIKTRAQQDILTGRLNTPPDYSEQRNSIGQIQDRLTKQLNVSDGLVTAQLTELKKVFSEKIEQQIALLKNYQLQAQLAVVRLNDEAYRKAQTEQRQGEISNGK